MVRYEEGTPCIVTGWGTTTEGGSLARVLQKVEFEILICIGTGDGPKTDEF